MRSFYDSKLDNSCARTPKQPGHFRELNKAGHLIAVKVRTQKDLRTRPVTPERFTDYSCLGLFVPWTVRTLLDCSYHGLSVPLLDDSYQVEKGNIVYAHRESKKSPWGFLTFFSKTVGIFSQNFKCLLHVHTYGRWQIFYSIISNFNELIPY